MRTWVDGVVVALLVGCLVFALAYAGRVSDGEKYRVCAESPVESIEKSVAEAVVVVFLSHVGFCPIVRLSAQYTVS